MDPMEAANEYFENEQAKANLRDWRDATPAARRPYLDSPSLTAMITAFRQRQQRFPNSKEIQQLREAAQSE